MDETAGVRHWRTPETTRISGMRREVGVPVLPELERPERNRRQPPGLNAAQARPFYEAESGENNGVSSTFCNDGCDVGHKRKTGQKARVS